MDESCMKAVQSAYKACVKTQSHKIGRYDVCIISSSSSFEPVVSRYNVAGDGEEWKVKHRILQRHMLRALRCGDVKRNTSSFH